MNFYSKGNPLLKLHHYFFIWPFKIHMLLSKFQNITKLHMNTSRMRKGKKKVWFSMMSKIWSLFRKTYCGMVSALDEVSLAVHCTRTEVFTYFKRSIYEENSFAWWKAVGYVTKALKMWNMADNTLIVFTSDNGAQNFKGGSNYPLRGGKVQLSPTT